MLGFVALFGYLNRWNDSMGTQLEGGAVDAGNARLKGRVGLLGSMGIRRFIIGKHLILVWGKLIEWR